MLYVYATIFKDRKNMQISVRWHNPEYITMYQDLSANCRCEHVSHALLSPPDTGPTHDPASLLMENGNQTCWPDRRSHTLEDVLETFHDKIKWFTPGFLPQSLSRSIIKQMQCDIHTHAHMHTHPYKL